MSVIGGPAVLRVGDFEFSAESGELRCDGSAILLQPQPLALLLALVSEPGKVLTREDLCQSLWPDQSYLEFDDGLNHAICKLREAFQDSAQSPRYIETIPKRGYRFIAPVEEVAPASSAPPVEPAAETLASPEQVSMVETPPRSVARLVVRAFAAVGVLAVLIAVAAWVTHRVVLSPSKTPVVAVLEIRNLSNDRTLDWLNEGLPEMLTTNLGQAGGVDVLSTELVQTVRQRLSRRAQPLSADVAREAGATAFVSGSLMKVGPTRLRLDLRVQEVSSGKILAARSIEAEDLPGIFSMVNTATSGVLQAVSPQVPRQATPVEQVVTSNLEAYQHYVAGHQFLRRFYWDEAVREYRAAIALDSEFAEAHLALAGVFRMRNDWRAANAELKAVGSLQHRLSSGALLGYQLQSASAAGNELAAITLLETQLQKFPRAGGRLPLALRLANQGQLQRSVELLNEGLALDPRDELLWCNIAYLHAAGGHFESAMEAAQRYLQLAPEVPNAWDTRGDVWFAFGHLEEAVADYEKVRDLKPDFIRHDAEFQIAFVRQQQGRVEESRAAFQRFAEANRRWALLPANTALLLEAEGDVDGALSQYQAAVSTLRKDSNFTLSGQVLSTYARLSLLLGRGPSALRFARRQSLDGEQLPVIALLQAGSGDLAAAESTLRQYASGHPELSAYQLEHKRALLVAWNALRRRDGAVMTAALATLPDPALHDDDWITFLRALGSLYAGDARASETLFRRFLTVHQNFFGVTFWVSHSRSVTLERLAHFYLAQAQERAWQRDEAMGEYRYFLSRYNSRSGLPQIAEARAALKRLRG